MPNTIKRNRKIFENIQKQLLRLELRTATLNDFFINFVAEGLTAGTMLVIGGLFKDEIKEDILDNDELLVETVKVLGIMEVSKDTKELAKNISKRQELKGKNREDNKTDFDKILGAMMKVPKPKE